MTTFKAITISEAPRVHRQTSSSRRRDASVVCRRDERVLQEFPRQQLEDSPEIQRRVVQEKFCFVVPSTEGQFRKEHVQN
jgi:hypothetical protein